MRRISTEARPTLWAMVLGTALPVATLIAIFSTASGTRVHAQSALTTSYATAECWDCAGDSSCPKSIGTVDGKNLKFVLRRAPVGATAVDVYLNGIRLRINADYKLSGQALTLLKAPQSGDSLDVRYSGSYAATVPAQ